MGSYIINADDFGMNEDVSNAIVKAFIEKRINRTSIMVNMEYFEEGYSKSIKYDFSSAIGLHLNLTEGMPLTKKIKEYELFCNKDGFFNGEIMQDNYHRVLPLPKNVKNAVYEEIDAQFRKYLDYYAQIGTYHMDSHHHIHKNMNILPLCLDVAKKYKFRYIRYASTFGSMINCLYNKSVNNYIRRNMKTPYYVLFNSVSDYLLKSNQTRLFDYFEVECHPRDVDGILFDGDIQLPLLSKYESN